MLGRVRGYKPSLVMGADRRSRDRLGDDRAERARRYKQCAGKPLAAFRLAMERAATRLPGTKNVGCSRFRLVGMRLGVVDRASGLRNGWRE